MSLTHLLWRSSPLALKAFGSCVLADSTVSVAFLKNCWETVSQKTVDNMVADVP